MDELASTRGAAEQKAYDDALNAALDPYGRDEPAPPAGGTRAPAVQAGRAPRAQEARPRAATPRAAVDPPRKPGGHVGEDLQVGTEVAVLRETWPRNSCKEMAGLAWHAVVVARAAGRATVKFTKACTRDGRRYENVQLSLDALRLIE